MMMSKDLKSFDSNESEKHPLNSEEKSMNKEDRHILNVTETDNTVVVEFEKHEDVEHEGEEVEITDEVSMSDSNEEERNVIDMPMKKEWYALESLLKSLLKEVLAWKC
jgi:hypothetical protein